MVGGPNFMEVIPGRSRLCVLHGSKGLWTNEGEDRSLLWGRERRTHCKKGRFKRFTDGKSVSLIGRACSTVSWGEESAKNGGKKGKCHIGGEDRGGLLRKMKFIKEAENSSPPGRERADKVERGSTFSEREGGTVISGGKGRTPPTTTTGMEGSRRVLRKVQKSK